MGEERETNGEADGDEQRLPETRTAPETRTSGGDADLWRRRGPLAETRTSGGDADLWRRRGQCQRRRRGQSQGRGQARVGEGKLQRVGEGKLQRVGEGKLQRVGEGKLQRVGEGKLQRVGEGKLQRVGEGKLQRVGEGKLQRVGEGILQRIWSDTSLFSDILNNLDNLESGCDLDDDDLMLDDDLPEHGSLHSDTDGMSHLTHWRRQLCWTAEDHLHNDNRSDVGFQPYDGYQGTGLAGLHQAVELDELTLKHMAEDCCFVKTQLEHLKLLLQVEGGSEMDNTLDTLSPESREDPVQARQVEELLKEVQELREELRSKDRIIAQLTKHVAVPVEPTRCHCQQHRDVERVTVTYHDKATQTPPWRGHAPQILQPSRPWPNSVQQPQPQERLTSSAHTEAPRDSSNPGCGDSAKMIPAPSLPQSPGSLKIASITKRPQEGPTTNSTQTSMAGFPRVVRGIQCRSSLRPGFTAPQSRLPPPPFRGLPCYSSANQASASSQGPVLPACPRTKAPRQTPGLREPEIGGLKARGLVHPSLLRLPKPKSH
ncbi:uncharacterized protein LOC120045365 [Salvelinus namaycush]|uniref:Uncharacterized protein LOC120045365 n=1 Tax=Salvelinus namaycush TaxID=8040 RepID=A0A8U0UB50_SALNM|nr:uncharacterized protein LOC120045365 [Salvelinus namaycush]